MDVFFSDRLEVRIYDDRKKLGEAAAADIAACMRKLLDEKPTIRVVFAAAPSQNETLKALREDPNIDWKRIHVFHMDEYVGLSSEAPQGFANFLKNALFDHVVAASVNLISSEGDPDQEACRYSRLLAEAPIDIVCMGIGENGHIAFNDPHVADFNDPLKVKKVDLDEVCRMQQVHDGCFPAIEDVPRYALTLTVPALAEAPYHFCMVPAAAKAEAVFRTVHEPIGENCPATILRRLPGSVLYCDRDSASMLKEGRE